MSWETFVEYIKAEWNNRTAKPNSDPVKMKGSGFDRNGDLLDPLEVARCLRSYNLNTTSVGFFGRDGNDPMDVNAAKKWLTKWVAAMRQYKIFTWVTVTGTGGPDGGLARPQYTSEWYNSVLNVMLEIGDNLVGLVPVAEGSIKEGAVEPAKSKIVNWYNMTGARWTGLKGWNYQTRPTSSQVPPGWVGHCHPQTWNDGTPGQLILTDAQIHPRINQGQYPNETVIAASLTSYVKQCKQRGLGFTYWGQWENSKIDRDAVKAVSKA